MEVKLVHPDDKEAQVVIATNDVQLDAFKSVGFVPEDDLKAEQEAKAQAAKEKQDQVADLQKQLKDAEKRVKAAEKAQAAAEKRADDAEKALSDAKKSGGNS